MNYDISNMGKISLISEAFALVKLIVEDVTEMSSMSDVWVTFGKMNSALYRKNLMERTPLPSFPSSPFCKKRCSSFGKGHVHVVLPVLGHKDPD